jgi:hypothetical protein
MAGRRSDGDRDAIAGAEGERRLDRAADDRREAGANLRAASRRRLGPGVGILVPADWWSGLVVAVAVSSLLPLAVCFSPILLNGFAIDLALLWLALLSGWGPAG